MLCQWQRDYGSEVRAISSNLDGKKAVIVMESEPEQSTVVFMLEQCFSE